VSYVALHGWWKGPALQAISAPGRARESMQLGIGAIWGTPVNRAQARAATTAAISTLCAFSCSLALYQLLCQPRAPPCC
jgi:hypothetical protein